jgi:hypothetical protein
MSSKSIYDPISESLGLEPNPNFDYDCKPDTYDKCSHCSGEFNSFFGKFHTDETKLLLSEQRKGKRNAMYGRSAISEKNLRWYNNGRENIYVSEGTQPSGYVPGRFGLKRKPHSKEHKEKISNSLKNNNCNRNRQRSVVSPRGKIYPSIKEAAKSCGLTASQFRHRRVDNGKWIIL